jgi:hypothetical protein
VLLIVVTGFAGTVRYAATANAVAHRRTSTTALRAAVMDRFAVTPRTSLAPAAAAGAWVVDACWDTSGQLLGTNPAASTTYACPDGATRYRSWVNVTANAGGASWTVNTYVERTDSGCTPASRYLSLGCSAADLLLTD